MKLKRTIVTAITTMFFLGVFPKFLNAATQEDIDCLVNETKKTQSITKYPSRGFEIKALSDEEKIGNLEKNVFFSIYYYPNEKGGDVPKIFVTINYITNDYGELDIKQMVIIDGGYDLPDGKPDAASEDRIFEKEVSVTYKNDEGKEVTNTLRSIEDMFTKKYDLNNPSEKEKIDQIFDDTIEIFKLKSKKKFTDNDKTRYNYLKQNIEELFLDSKYFQKSRENLKEGKLK